MSYTDAEMLIAVRAAIMKLVGGAQEYAIGEVRYKRADLPELRRTEQWLTNRIATAGSGGGMTLAEF